MFGKHTKTVASITFAILLTTSLATPGLATHETDEEPFFDGLIADDSVGVAGQAAAEIAKITSWVARQDVPFLGETETGNATAYADDFRTEFNQHNGTIETYASSRLNASPDYEVFAIHFTDQQDNNVTRYLVSDTANGAWQNARVLNESEYDALMNREVDHWVGLDWYQSKHAASELDSFVTEYANPDDDLTAAYRAKMLAKYGAPDSDMWTNGSDS